MSAAISRLARGADEDSETGGGISKMAEVASHMCEIAGFSRLACPERKKGEDSEEYKERKGYFEIGRGMRSMALLIDTATNTGNEDLHGQAAAGLGWMLTVFADKVASISRHRALLHRGRVKTARQPSARHQKPRSPKSASA